MFAEKQSLVEITAKPLPMREIPEMFFIHRRITMRHEQAAVELPIHCGEDDGGDGDEEEEGMRSAECGVRNGLRTRG